MTFTYYQRKNPVSSFPITLVKGKFEEVYLFNKDKNFVDTLLLMPLDSMISTLKQMKDYFFYEPEAITNKLIHRISIRCNSAHSTNNFIDLIKYMRVLQLINKSFNPYTYYEQYLEGNIQSPMELLMTLDNFAYSLKAKVYNIKPISSIINLLNINVLNEKDIIELLNSLRALRYYNKTLTTAINEKLLSIDLVGLTHNSINTVLSSLYAINQEEMGDELLFRLCKKGKFDGMLPDISIRVLDTITKALPTGVDQLLVRIFSEIPKSNLFLRQLSATERMSLARSIWIFNKLMSKTSKDNLRPTLIKWANNIHPTATNKNYLQYLKQTYNETPIEDYIEGPLIYDYYLPNNNLVVEIKDHMQYLY